jgi:glycosyltransferase involved in cell wall biosynthesis
LSQAFKISVIVPVKNEGKKIGNCLEAIFKQTLQPFEVIVVDGNSTDNTVENANKYPIRLFYENYRTRAGACKVGVENASGEFIAFTDADCIVKNNWLENLMKGFGDGIVGVGGGIKNQGEGIWKKSISFAVGTFLGSAFSIQGRIYTKKKYVKSISGCNSIYRKENLLNIGNFDVRLPTAEDTELNSRLLKIGKLLYVPDAVILHNHNRGLAEFAKRMQQYGYGRIKSRLWDVQVIPPLFFFFLVLSLIFTPLLFFFILSIYFILLAFMAIKFAAQMRDFKYLYSIPIVYMIIHGAYMIGIGKGILKSRSSFFNTRLKDSIN